jgi:hypothetical protein
MNIRRKGPSSTRVDYQWRVDRELGFEKTSMIYDVDGRLVGIDYQSAERPAREVTPREATVAKPA